MTQIARRALFAGAGVIAAGTVAAAMALRKPAGPHIYTLAEGTPPPDQVRGQDMSALQPTTPAKSLSDITFSDANGKGYRIADFAGKGVVLNLWATWCVPCVSELPSLAALARGVAGDGIVVLALSTDRGGAPVVQRFYASHAINGLDVWLDPKSAAAEALGLRGVPTTLLIDRQGREQARLEGAADWAAPDALAAVRRLTKR